MPERGSKFSMRWQRAGNFEGERRNIAGEASDLILFVVLLIVTASHPAAKSVLKLPDALPKTFAQFGQLSRTEQDQHNQQDEKKVSRLKQAFHNTTSRPGAHGTPLPRRLVL